MLTGLPAFYERQAECNYKRILHESVGFKKYISRDARSIMLDLLEKNPTERLKEASEVKKHDFFDRTNWEAILNMTAELPKNLGGMQESTSQEGSSGIELITDYYQEINEPDEIDNKDASSKIQGDPFLGFSYRVMSPRSALNVPDENFNDFPKEPTKSGVPDFLPVVKRFKMTS